MKTDKSSTQQSGNYILPLLEEDINPHFHHIVHRPMTFNVDQPYDCDCNASLTNSKLEETSNTPPSGDPLVRNGYDPVLSMSTPSISSLTSFGSPSHSEEPILRPSSSSSHLLSGRTTSVSGHIDTDQRHTDQRHTDQLMQSSIKDKLKLAINMHYQKSICMPTGMTCCILIGWRPCRKQIGKRQPSSPRHAYILL